MSKVVPMDLIKSMTGKVCQHSNVYFFNRNGKCFSGKRCYPNTAEPTEAQKETRTNFAQAYANVKALTAEEQAAYKEAFEAYPDKYTTLRGYIFAKELAKLKA